LRQTEAAAKPVTLPPPTQFVRRVLLAVTGLSPKIVTETLFALTQKRKPPFVPTEVHLITTAQGAGHARLNLLSGDPGWFHRFCRDYGLEGITFDAERIHLLISPDGQLIADIRTPEDNEQAADLIAETLAVHDSPAIYRHRRRQACGRD
jgi:CRISPR-associated protein (TIGR02584 family)